MLATPPPALVPVLLEIVTLFRETISPFETMPPPFEARPRVAVRPLIVTVSVAALL